MLRTIEIVLQNYEMEHGTYIETTNYKILIHKNNKY